MNKLHNNSNVNKNKNTNSDEDEDGLVEPEDDEDDESLTEDEEETDQEDADEGDEEDTDETDDDKETVTMYFPKADSECGEVFAVEREMELGDDPYGEIVLAAMAGPTADESDYVDGIPSTVRLRQVQYTSAGPLLTVNEGYDELDTCQQQTVDASLIETSNAMFELSEGGSGEVVVGEIEDEEEDTTNTNESTDDSELTE